MSVTQGDSPDPYQPYHLDLTESERETLGKILRRRLEMSLTGRREHDDMVLTGRDLFDSISRPKTFPWPNCANLNVPITRSIIESIHARILRVMRGVEPFFRVTPMKGEDEEVCTKIEGLLQWQMATEVEYPQKLDPLVMMALRDGNAVGFVEWAYERDVVKDRVPLTSELRAKFKGADSKDIAMHPDGTMVEVEQDEVVKNGPNLHPIDILDFVLYPYNARSIKTALMCGHRYWANADDLRRGVRDGLYDEKEVDDIIEQGASMERPNEQQGVDVDRQADMGIENGSSLESEDMPYEMFHLVVKYDADNDGIAEDIIVRIEYSTGIIASAYKFPYWHRRRPYIDFTPYPRPGHFYGYSLPGILGHLAAEINAIRNQRVDAGTLALSPMMVGRRGSRYDPKKNGWRPGGFIWLDSTDDLKPITFQAPNQSAFAEEQAAREMAERVSGASDYAQGQSPSKSRTLGEVQAVLSEGNLKFDVVIRRLQTAADEFAAQVLYLNRQFLDALTEYLITRDDGSTVFETFSKQDIARRVGVMAHGNTLNSNPELEMQVAEKLYMMSERNPLMGTPTRLWEISKNYLVKMGIKFVIPYIGTKEEAAKKEQAQASQPPPAPPPSLSGKMDETTTLAVLLKDDPGIAEFIQKAALMRQVLGMGKDSEIGAGEPDAEGDPAAAGMPPGGMPEGAMSSTGVDTGSPELNAMLQHYEQMQQGQGQPGPEQQGPPQ